MRSTVSATCVILSIATIAIYVAIAFSKTYISGRIMVTRNWTNIRVYLLIGLRTVCACGFVRTHTTEDLFVVFALCNMTGCTF